MKSIKHGATKEPLPLFGGRNPEREPLDLETRLRDFARAAAVRGRGAPLDVERFIGALRAYHRAWTICSRIAVPALEEREVRVAVAAYCEAKGARKKPAA